MSFLVRSEWGIGDHSQKTRHGHGLGLSGLDRKQCGSTFNPPYRCNVVSELDPCSTTMHYLISCPHLAGHASVIRRHACS